MASGFRVRLGEAPKYRPASAEHAEAVAFARLAESNYQLDQAGNWVDQGTTWYDGVFTGRQAELIREYQSGDMLLALGNHRTVETVKDGKTYTNEKLYVNHFSPDLSDRAVTVVMDRSLRQSAQRAVNADQDQEADQQVNQAEFTGNELDPRDAPGARTRNEVEAEMFQRLEQLVQVGRVSPDDAHEVIDAFKQVKDRDPDTVYQTVVYASQKLPPVEAEWVKSVPRNLVTGYAPYTWEEADNAARVAAPAIPAQPVQYASTAPVAGPSM